MRSLAAYITLLSVLTASSAVPTSRYERLELARSGTGAASNRPRLPAEVHRQLLLNGRPQIGLHKALTEQLVAQQAQGHIRSGIQSHNPAQQAFATPEHDGTAHYKAHCFEQPVSHFDSSVNGTFCQRFWYDDRYYKEGGPVYLLDGGETSGADRLPFLQQGILQILSNATNGLGIVLEHRYYGESVPLPSFSTDDLRFLNNAEALEDSANFIKQFSLPSYKADTFNHTKTPWIYYGGSYAGARAAHMRVQYPDLVWGAIASSAVTHAQIDFPQYFDPIQQYGPPECIAAIESSVKAIDAILDLPGPAGKFLKRMFGLEELEDDDFADVLQSPLGAWQAQNWNPKVGSHAFQGFCDALLDGHAGSSIGLIKVPAAVVNYAKYIKENIVSQCPEEAGIEACFGSHNDEVYLADDLDQVWRLWMFQVCTQWGYFMPAHTDGPSLLSKRLTLDFTSKLCKQAYPSGKHFSVPEWPDVEEVNRRGDYAIQSDRLAFIDGDRDPWRTMTPQADWAPKRQSTSSRPRHIIPDAIHHYDENGLKDHSDEPSRIKRVHAMEVEFIQAWLKEWKQRDKA